MVVGTHVEVFVVVMIEPADVFLPFRNRCRSGRSLRLMGNLGHHPGTGDDGMGLQVFQRRRRLHLGGNDTEQVIFHADHVHRHHLSIFHDKFEHAREGLVLPALPVEIHPDRHPVQDERGLGEHLGRRDRIERQFIVQDSVVVDFSVPVAHRLLTGTIRNHLEGNLLTGHDSHLQGGLGAGKAVQDAGLVPGRKGDLRHHRFQRGGIHPFEFLLHRHHIQAAHIGAPGT